MKASNGALTIALRDAERERDALKVERDVYFHYANKLGDMYPLLTIADKMPLVVNPVTEEDRSIEWPPMTISNLVWYVDGSRRFPMAAGDVLWIPEGQFWVRLEPGAGSVLPTQITVSPRSSRPPASELQDDPPVVSRFEESLGTFDLGDHKTIYEIAAKKQGSNCAQLQLAETSNRDLGPDYIDMIVTFVNKTGCGDDNPPPVAP